jgi:hypothetical protein
VKNFHILGNWVVWKVGKGNKLLVGEDHWIGCCGKFRLLEASCLSLHEKWITRLRDAATFVVLEIGIQGWKFVEDLQ